MSTLTGVTASIGGTELFGGGCFTATLTITGAAVGMVVTTTPRVYPGSGITWQGYVSAPNTITVKVCSTIAAFVTASVYDVQVNDGAAGGAGLVNVLQVEVTGADVAAINNTAKVLIPAPGAGKMIQLNVGTSGLNSIPFQTTTGTTPYTQYGDLPLEVHYGSLSGQKIAEDQTSVQVFLGQDDYDSSDFNVGQGTPFGHRALFENQPLILQGSANSSGRIFSLVLNAPGTGYAPGDTGTINGGDDDAVYVVDTVDGGGGVLTLHLTAPGTGFFRSTQPTTATSGAGTGLTVDITVQSTAGGNGSVWFSIAYMIVDLH